MIDLSVMSYRELLKISKVDVVELFPTTLRITGPDMRTAVEVNINGLSSDFIVVDNTKLSVRLPTQLEKQSINNIVVYGDRDISDKGNIELKLDGAVKSGVAKLIQQITLLLLQLKGSDIFDDNAGGGLLVYSENLSINDPTVSANLASIVDQVRQQIKDGQSGRVLSREETLMNLQLLGVDLDKNTLKASITVKITTGVGDITILV